MNTYTPQPGTIAERVINSLLLLGQDVEVSTPVLLEAIGQPSDWHGLGTCLGPAVDAGVVHKRIEGRKAFWRLGVHHKHLAHGVANAGQAATATRAEPVSIQVDRVLVAPAEIATGPACTRSHPHELMSQACVELTEQAREVAQASAPGAAEPVPPQDEPAADDRPAADLAEELGQLVDAEFVEVAISNTGRLLISNGTQQIALSPEQTEKVFEYIDAHRGIEWEGAEA